MHDKIRVRAEAFDVIHLDVDLLQEVCVGAGLQIHHSGCKQDGPDAAYCAPT
jgi:hypothetical protein